MSSDIRSITSYGKARVPVYRVYAHPLTGVPRIPESSFTGRSNTLFALEVDVEVSGNNFLPAYTHGDNSNIVATDSMKNIILREALTYDGATYEAFLNQLAHHFLTTYPHMESLRLTARELAFTPIAVPQNDNDTFSESSLLFSRSRNDYAFAMLDFTRHENTPMIVDHRCGRLDLQLFKVTGSAFTHFVNDEFTTLPERKDRPLFIYLDVFWKYRDVEDMLAPTHEHYVPAEQVRDLVQVVFDEFVSESIQHLVHEIGQRLLVRFPQLQEVSFEAQNRTRDPFFASETDERVKVYSDPFSAYGQIKLTLTHN
jgi:urate oxidase